MNKKLLKAIYPELAGAINGEESNELMQDLLLEMKKDRSLKMDGIQAITYKGDKGDDGYTPIKDVDYRDGIDGENYYHLTEQDKQSIIQSIEVPIVDKIIEKTEVIRELPIVTNQIVEKAVPDTADEIANKLNTLEEKIEPKVIIGLEDKFNKFAESFKKGGKNQLKLNDVAGAPLDQRWHGGGLSKVSHDATLSGSGTPSDPLVVIGSGSSITLKTNGVANGSQSILNLKQGTNVTLADDGVGGVTINSTASGSGTVTSVTSATADATVATTTTTPVITIVSAPKLATARTISGTSFDGTANITLNNTGITNGAGYTTNVGTVTSVSGVTNRTTITGVATVNPTVDIASTYVGQSSITTLGTIGSGVWNGTAIAAINGGTGQTGYAVGDLLYASTTTALSKLADIATGNALISGGVGVAPSWGKIGLTTHVSGTLPVANGGTNAGAFTAGSIVFAGASGTYTQDNANFFWDNTNKIMGIGTNTPSSSASTFLHVKGASAGVSLESTSRKYSFFATGANFGFYDENAFAYRMYILSTGAIGFGTASPQSTYDFNGSISAGTYAGVSAAPSGGLILSGNVGVGTATPSSSATQFVHVKGPSAGITLESSSRKYSFFATGANFGFFDETASAYRMYILSTGEVGFGTNAPSAKMHAISTTEQKRLGYDASNYFSTTVGSTGSTTFALTGTSPIFTFSQEVRNTVAGTNSASIVTVGGTQNLTGKTLTSPVINTPTGIVKGDVGLGNVDNTSDVNKPVSTATQTALDLKANLRVITSITGTTTALAVARTDYVYIVSSGTFVFTLPTAVSNTNRYALKNNGSGTLTMGSTSGQTIDNLTASTFTLLPGDSLEFISDNTNFIII